MTCFRYVNYLFAGHDPNLISLIMNDDGKKELNLSQNIWFWANIYKVSLTIFALQKVGVFDSIIEKECSLDSLAEDLQLSKKILEPLLSLLVRVGLVRFSEKGYELEPNNKRFMPLLELEREMHIHHITLNNLCQALKGNFDDDPMEKQCATEMLSNYTSGMSVSARTIAPHVTRILRSSSISHLVDLGGADGSLGLFLCQLISNLKVTIIDRPQMETFFDKLLKNNPARSQMDFVPGNLRELSSIYNLLGRADAVLLSNVLHLFSSEERESILKTLLHHTRKGTQIVIYDLFLPGKEVLDVTSLMTLDWLLFGYSFAITEADFISELSQLGFLVVENKRIENVPGALIRAIIP